MAPRIGRPTARTGRPGRRPAGARSGASGFAATSRLTASLAKRERDVSVLFLDISGYARLSERLPAGALNAMVESYFSAFLDAIHEAGGDINETAGDGFMAVFQDADARVHAVQAVGAGVGVLGLTDRLNQQNPEHPLSIHMGINSGLALGDRDADPRFRPSSGLFRVRCRGSRGPPDLAGRPPPQWSGVNRSYAPGPTAKTACRSGRSGVAPAL